MLGAGVDERSTRRRRAGAGHSGGRRNRPRETAADGSTDAGTENFLCHRVLRSLAQPAGSFGQGVQREAAGSASFGPQLGLWRRRGTGVKFAGGPVVSTGPRPRPLDGAWGGRNRPAVPVSGRAPDGKKPVRGGQGMSDPELPRERQFLQ